MNKIVILLLLAIVSCQGILAQTYYYKFTKSIIQGKIDISVKGGQFITFDRQKCYESDKNGNEVGNGVMAYDIEASKQTNLETYWGSCYWSKNAYMKFNADKSVMNIETNAGKIYVYKRSTAPAGVTTCSLIREPEPSNNEGSNGGYTPPITPDQQINPQGGYIGGGTTVNPGGGGKIISQEQNKPQKTRHTCTLCKGSGRYERNDGSVPLYGGNDYKVRCQECGYEHYRSTNHRHVTCPQCYGRGYKEY